MKGGLDAEIYLKEEESDCFNMFGSDPHRLCFEIWF